MVCVGADRKLATAMKRLDRDGKPDNLPQFEFVTLHCPPGRKSHVGTAQAKSFDPNERNWDMSALPYEDLAGVLRRIEVENMVTDDYTLMLDAPVERISGTLILYV